MARHGFVIRRVAVDPTPTNPVLLRLMEESEGAAVYLGRPCYFGLSTSKGCEPRLWTFDRYGREIVESMCLAANEIARQHGAQSVQLIGYSGGGTIVVGMRSCTDHLVAVATIAANPGSPGMGRIPRVLAAHRSEATRT